MSIFEDSNILGPEYFSDDPEVLLQLWENHYAETFGSNWDILRYATSSCCVAAAQTFGSLINSWQRSTSSNQPAAETSIVLEINYRTVVLGPLLATIIHSAFCLECLIHLVAEAMLIISTDNRLTQQFSVEGFDRQSFDDRLKAAIDLSGCKPLSKEMDIAVKELILFRNNCAHDTPYYRTSLGVLKKMKRGKMKQINDQSMYPAFHTSMVPLTIRHAKQAIETHDAVVNHMKNSCSDDFFEQLKDFYPHLQFDGIMAYMPSNIRGDIIDNQIEIWEKEVLPWKDQISMKEHEKEYRKFVRKTKIKRVQ